MECDGTPSAAMATRSDAAPAIKGLLTVRVLPSLLAADKVNVRHECLEMVDIIMSTALDGYLPCEYP